MYLVLKPDSTQKNAYWDSFISVVKNYPCEGIFLEIGAADLGQITAHRKIFSRLIGVDFKFTRLPKLSNIKMVNADAQFLPFKNEVFDGIISHHVIEHVEKGCLLLSEIKRTLKKDGFAILGTPNRKRLIRVLVERFTGKRKFPWRNHKREYVKQELLDLGNKIGFVDVSVHCKFLGLHTYQIIFGFSRVPRMFEMWTNFLFLVLIK